MPDRSDTITSFLRTTEWADAAVQPLAGDASMRKYLRIGPNSSGRPAVLMDADPALGNDTGPFIKITDYLRSLSLSAPEIYARDEGAGLLLIEDLGDALFARVTQTDPDMEETLYAHATDVLLHLHRAAPPALTEYDTAQMTEMAALAFDWYALGATGTLPTAARAAFTKDIAGLLDGAHCTPSVLIQRDYHAENLLWLPERDGPARVGLLDYQDAQLGHPAYDLVSLLKDARRDVSPDIETQMIARYITASGSDRQAFETAYHVLGLQRNLRILGVFARLSFLHNKPGYVDFIPRVWAFIERDLRHPACAPLAPALTAALPPPTPDILESLKAQCGTHRTP